MPDETKQAQYTLNALVNQRNRALDECAQLAAMVSIGHDEIVALKAKVSELEKTSEAPAAALAPA